MRARNLLVATKAFQDSRGRVVSVGQVFSARNVPASLVSYFRRVDEGELVLRAPREIRTRVVDGGPPVSFPGGSMFSVEHSIAGRAEKLGLEQIEVK
jgi:hypothetical protein